MKNYHIGCSYTIGKSWVNIDSSPFAFFDQIFFLRQIFNFNKKKFPKGIVYGDIVKKPLCEEGTADNIYCSHTLEHVSYEDGKQMIKNMFVMLKKGGILRIIVPSLEARIQRYMRTSNANEFMKSLNAFHENENQSLFTKLRFLFGNSRHRWMYDKKSLSSLLLSVGFNNIRECQYNDSEIDVFFEVEDKTRFIEDSELKAICFHCEK
jgi:predicted SAM-dependent methyltransferase